MDYRQKDQPQQLTIVEFAVNSKVYMVTKISLFMKNYRREPRIEANIRRKRKAEKVMEFVERIKKVQKKLGAVLRKTQEEMKKTGRQGIERDREVKKE